MFTSKVDADIARASSANESTIRATDGSHDAAKDKIAAGFIRSGYSESAAYALAYNNQHFYE